MSDNKKNLDELEILKKLSEAIKNTLKNYSKEQCEYAMYQLLKKSDYHGFSNEGNNINSLQKFDIEDVKSVVYKKYIEEVCGDFEGSSEPIDVAIRRTYEKYKGNESIDIDKTLENILKDSIDNEYDKEGAINISKRMTAYFIDLSKTESEIGKISNIEINSQNLEKCRSAIMSGVRGFQREGTISIGQELTACSSIGKIRKNQEDAVLLIVHPQNPEFKMMVVADGMGGLEVGEEASNILVNEIKSWFESLDVSYFYNMEDLDDDLSQQLQTISDYIYQKFRGRAGTTFVGAIVGKNDTLISNIGDSRGYILQGKELMQVTKDHSLVQHLYDRGEIQYKDDMRFHKDSNYITQCIGLGDILEPSSQILRNSEYNCIILTSDGVTDCLSDDKILAITRNTDKRKLAEVLVQEALNTNSFRTENLKSLKYDNVIYGGKDNATAAVLYTGVQKQINSRERFMEREDPDLQNEISQKDDKLER